LGDKVTRPWAKSLLDRFAYIVVGQGAYMDVSVEMPPGTPIDHIRMFPSPGFVSQSSQGILLYKGPSSSGPWELVVEHNKFFNPTPMSMA
jgi:hypothetical protein